MSEAQTTQKTFPINTGCQHGRREAHGDGMCSEGCCDKYKCLDCEQIFLVEGGD